MLVGTRAQMASLGTESSQVQTARPPWMQAWPRLMGRIVQHGLLAPEIAVEGSLLTLL
jgi:hypothetical protein